MLAADQGRAQERGRVGAIGCRHDHRGLRLVSAELRPPRIMPQRTRKVNVVRFP
jgi:hypothetical protein